MQKFEIELKGKLDVFILLKRIQHIYLHDDLTLNLIGIFKIN